MERPQRKYCAPTASLVVLSWIKGTSIHILSFTFTFFYAFILRGVTMENVCNAATSIYQPTFPCFIPVITNTSGYGESYNSTSRNKKQTKKKSGLERYIFLNDSIIFFSSSILYRCHFLLMSTCGFCP